MKKEIAINLMAIFFIKNVKLFSKSLDKFINMKICVRSLKTVEKNGGLDDYLTKTSNRVLAPEAIAIKNTILKHEKKEKIVS
mgnify:CR=1 FL=1